MNVSIKAAGSMLLLSTLLTACGGGEGDITTENTIPDEPMSLTASNWTKNSQQSAAKSPKAPSIHSFYGVNGPMPPAYKTQNIIVSDIQPSKHYQIFINMDNDASTGYQFDGEAWSTLSGADYMIEDNDIYQSTANDSSWSWKYVETDYFSNGSMPTSGRYYGRFPNPTKVQVHFGGKFIKNLCKEFTVGYVGRDENWGIETFYPHSNKMLKQQTTFCGKPSVNTPPKIALKGSKHMFLVPGTPFVDPGVTASDKEDGNLTHLIKTAIYKIYSKGRRDLVKEIIPTKDAHYTIYYEVTDSEGQKATVVRELTFNKKAGSKIIDGERNDWPPFANIIDASGNGSLWVADDTDNLYILIKASNLGANTQVFIDSNHTDPGYIVYAKYPTGYTWSIDAETLVENSDGYSYTGTNSGYAWLWKNDLTGVKVVRKENILEMAIPKSYLNNNSNNDGINFGFVSLDSNWNHRYILTMDNYKFKH